MSWSISAVGKPAAVKAALVDQFARSKHSTAAIAHENESVGLVEQIVNGQLDYLVDAPGVAVRVEANGSAYKSTHSGQVSVGTNVSLKVEQIHGFVE